MPRETIKADSAPSEGTLADFDLSIGWDRDQELMQVAVLLPPGETILSRLYGDDRCRARIGEQFVQHMRERPDEFLLSPYESNEQMLTEYARLGGLFLYWAQEARGWVGERDGLWFHLTHRRTANRIIRLLKKARDAAFGRDE
jgi:hypothetical protein